MTPTPRMRDLARDPRNWLELAGILGTWAAIVYGVPFFAALLS